MSEVQAQTKVVMHLQTADTLVYRALVNQVNNMKKEIPDAAISIVCHGPGMNFILKENATYINLIQKQQHNHVEFVGCDFTMQQRNIKKEALVDYAKTVSYAMVEIIKMQQAGAIYVKLGF